MMTKTNLSVLIGHILLLHAIGFVLRFGDVDLSLFSSHVGPPLMFLLGFLFVGLVCVHCNWRSAAHWIRLRLTTFALLGTVLGLILGLTGISIDPGNPEALEKLLQTIGLAFYATLFGLGGFIWMDLILAITRRESGDL